MLIKIFLIFVLLVLTVATFKLKLTAKHIAFRRLGILVFFILAVVAIIFPQFTSEVANLIGVGRGADLLLYLFVLVFLFSQFITAKHRTQLEREVTKLAREIALLETQIEKLDQSERVIAQKDNALE